MDKGLEKLYFAEEIMERYRIHDRKTAVRKMRAMGAQGRGKSLFVRESQIIEYELALTTKPEKKAKKNISVLSGHQPRSIEEMLVKRI